MRPIGRELNGNRVRGREKCHPLGKQENLLREITFKLVFEYK